MRGQAASSTRLQEMALNDGPRARVRACVPDLQVTEHHGHGALPLAEAVQHVLHLPLRG